MQVQLNTRIEHSTMEALNEYVQRTGKSKASVTDAALLEYLKKEESSVTDWTDVLEYNEESIIYALFKAYETACGGQPTNKNLEACVFIDKEGNISINNMQSNETPAEVANGNEICVGAKKFFNPWDEVSEDTEILESLCPEEKEAYIAWMKENYYGENHVNYIGFDTLEEWNKEVANRIHNEVIQAFIEGYAYDWAEETFNRRLQELKERA